jgi:putative flippase GtrA
MSFFRDAAVKVTAWSPRLQKLALRLYDTRILQFLFVGGSAFLLHQFIAWFITSRFFDVTHYEVGYTIGLIAAWFYNFVLHTVVTFRTKTGHGKRFLQFIIYSLTSSVVQYFVMHAITPRVGEEHYLWVNAGVVLCVSLVTFVVFKLWLFKEK